MFSRAEIEKLIPHREPFIFIDEVVSFEPKKAATSLKHLTGEEAFFAGHFPGQPVFPGVLILENMAQTANFLVAKSFEAEQGAIGGGPRMVFGMVNRARFLKPVLPPATLTTEVTAVKLFTRMGVVEAVSKVGDQTVAKATFQFGAMHA
ncbi:MAG: 3-hydroxyacyl-ACP dehydratase FabZ [Deltaproteobacteria bacterium]|nr:3-hydroxyacyl-ACP dehydratase FabZ [Deltaproteobacteria bacterium]